LGIHEIRVTRLEGDPTDQDVKNEAKRTLGIDNIDSVRTIRVYRLEGILESDARKLASVLFADPVTERSSVDEPINHGAAQILEVGYKPGVMNPATESIMKAAKDLGVNLLAADVSTEYAFIGKVNPSQVSQMAGRFLVNRIVQQVTTEKPATLLFENTEGTIRTVPVRDLSDEGLMALSNDKLFLNVDEMHVIQEHFCGLGRDPKDAELEIMAAKWSEHCGHKTFDAIVVVDGVEKKPLFTRIKEAAKDNFGDLVVSAFVDNAEAIKFYDG